VRAATAVLGVALAVAACLQTEEFSPRTRVGTVPESFTARAVTSAADAAAYVDAYARALGVEDVRAERALGFDGRYWVYVGERNTGRAAFSLEVREAGGIDIRKFPTMAPEMMWNQKYGHRARPDPAAIEERLAPAEAEELLRRRLPEDSGLRPGEPSTYWGYVLFPLCEGSRLVGEAAVNTADREVVWNRFLESPLSSWTAPGAGGTVCD
jgi:hypothetical protein